MPDGLLGFADRQGSEIRNRKTCNRDRQTFRPQALAVALRAGHRRRVALKPFMVTLGFRLLVPALEKRNDSCKSRTAPRTALALPIQNKVLDLCRKLLKGRAEIESNLFCQASEAPLEKA